MHRFSFLLAPLLIAAACTDATAPSADTDPLDDVTLPPSSTDPGDPAAEPTPEPEVPARCVSVPSAAVQLGTFAHDELRDVVVTANGAVVIAGFELGTSRTGAGELIGTRGVVLEYAHDLASVERRAELRTEGTDSFDSLAVDPATGELWAAARTNGTVAGLQARGNYDVVIGTLGATGFTPLHRGHDSTPEQPKQLAIGAGGLLAVAGHETRVVLDGSTWTNPFLAAFTASTGALRSLWYTTRRAAQAERYAAVDVTAGAMFVGGAIDDGEQAGTFVAKWSDDADPLWRTRLSTVGGGRVDAVEALPNGDVLWVGTTTADETTLGGTDIIVGVLDGATGAPRWSRMHGSAADDRAADVALDAQGRIYVVGTTASERGDTDALLLVLDADGALAGEEHWTSDGDDAPTAVTVDACGAVVIVGNTDGDLAGTPLGSRDGFLLVTRFAE